MAHHKSALKRIKLIEKQTERNRTYKSRMRTALKSVLSTEDKEKATAQLPKAYAVIDKLVAKGILQKNTAANKKSRLARHVNALS